MKTYIEPKRREWSAITKRPTQDVASLETTVLEVFKEVKNNGDTALKYYTQLYDKVNLNNNSVSYSEIEASENKISPDLKQAILVAKHNIMAFHTAQKTKRITVETTKGVNCWQEKRAIEKVGLYIPGGTAPLFSTILMLAIPASIAGCKEIVLCTPPDKDGNIHPAILFTAKLCGVTTIFKVGGIQAIAGMTFGTETIPRVYKIFGPGNQFVTAAKQAATKFGVAIDMPAGPSELLVYADQSANPAFVASDLLSQAEHGSDSQVVLVTNTSSIATKVAEEVATQLKALPRKKIAAEAIKHSKAVVFSSKTEASDFINYYAPEHYILVSEDESFFLDKLINAGSVFIGNYTPESAGDYASGTNHTLPTNGYAKQYSGVNLDAFLKSITFQKISKQGLSNIGPSIEFMAAAEGLQAHKNAVTLRLNSLKDE